MTHHPEWTFLHPKMTYNHLGFLPSFLNEDDERDAVTQLDTAYQHGGGWNDFSGFKAVNDVNGLHGLQYPGDPVYKPLAFTKLRDETIVFYDHSWVAVFQPDNSFRVSRMD